MASRPALKNRGEKCRRQLGNDRNQGDNGARESTKDWLSGWVEELNQGSGAQGKGAAQVAAAAQPLGGGRAVVGFAHCGSLIVVQQASPTKAAVLVYELTPHGGELLPACEPAVAFALEAMAVLAGGSVPDYLGGPCRPLLLVTATCGKLQLLLLSVERRQAAVVWEVEPPPQGTLAEERARIAAGPSVLLLLTSGELWVACNYGAQLAHPSAQQQQQQGSRGWRLHKLAVGGGRLLPCELRPCWELQEPPAQLEGSHGAGGNSSAAGDVRAGVVCRADGCAEAQPLYDLLALASLQQPARPDSNQEQQERQGLVAVRVPLAAGGCPSWKCEVHHVSSVAVPGRLEEITAACLAPQEKPQQGAPAEPATIVVATASGQVHLLPFPMKLPGEGQQAGPVVECGPGVAAAGDGGLAGAPAAAAPSGWLPAPAQQLHFLQDPRRGTALLVAVCVGGTTCVLSWPGLELLAQQVEEGASYVVEGCEALLCSLQASAVASSGLLALDGASTSLPAALLVSSDAPGAAAPHKALLSGSGPAYAFLPAAHLSGGPGSRGGVNSRHSLLLLHELPQPDEAGMGADSDDARRGMLQVLSSLQHRLDEGHVQEEQLRQLGRQKECTIAAGEAALERHCLETWGPAAAAAASPDNSPTGSPLAGVGAGGGAQDGMQAAAAGSWAGRGVRVAALEVTRSGMEQWRLRAELQGPSEGMLRSAQLVASSPWQPLSCTHPPASALPAGAPAAAGPAPSPGARVELSCTLSMPQQALSQLGSLWVDVGVIIGGRGEGVQPLRGPYGNAYLPAGLVELHLKPAAQPSSSSGSGMQQLQQQEADGGVGEREHGWQHQLDLAVQSQGMELYCLHAALLQLGAGPASPSGTVNGASSGQQQQQQQQQQVAYALHQTVGTAPAGQVLVIWHSAHFAELSLKADDPLLLESLRAGLERGLQAAAQQAGANITLQPSLLAPQQAQRAVDAAGALLAEVDACMEWVEALLRERLAVDSQYSRDKLPRDPAGLLARQREALEACIAANELVAGVHV